MATDLTIQSFYEGKQAGEIIGHSFREMDTLQKGLIKVYENVNYKLNLRKIKYIDGTVDFACDFTPEGEIDLSEKVLEPKKFKNDLLVCKEEFRKTWSEDLEGASAWNVNLASDIETAITLEVLKAHAQKVDDVIWNGDSANNGEFDGFIKQFDADAGVIKPAGAGVPITTENVLAELMKCLGAVPAQLQSSSNLKIAVSPDVYQAYNFYLVSQGVANGLGGANMPVSFAGYEMVRVGGLEAGTIVVFERDNLVFATGLLGDHNEIKTADEDRIGLLSGNVRFRMVWNGAVGYYNSQDIVYYVAEAPVLDAPEAPASAPTAKKATPKK